VVSKQTNRKKGNTKMPKGISWDSPAPSEGKDVENTRQLKPRTGAEPFNNETNEEKRHTTKRPNYGELGVKGFPGK
jgi:hypothetical protein